MESVGKTLKNIGACFMELEDYENAKLLFNLALSQYSLDEIYDRSRLNQLLGFVLIKSKDLDSALIYLNRSQKLIEDNNKKKVQHFQINISKCLVYIMQKDYKNAKMIIDSLNRILYTTEELSKLFNIRQKIINSVYYDSLKNYSEAIYYLKAANTLNHCNNTGKILYSSIYTESLFKIGKLYKKLYSLSKNHNHLDSSITYYKNAINQLNVTSAAILEDKSKLLYQQYVHSYIKEYLTVLVESHNQNSKNTIEEIINTSELSKYYVLTHSINNKEEIPIKHSQYLIEEFLKIIKHSPKNINYALESIPLNYSIPITKKDSILIKPKEVNLKYIQNQLDSTDIIINYIQSSNYFYCCLIQKTHIFFFELGSIKTISEKIKKCNKALKKFLNEDTLKEILADLHKTILEPMKAHIPDESNLYIIPEGIFSRAPFDCLWDGKNYFIENHTILNCFNLESWKQTIGKIDSIPSIHFFAPSVGFSKATFVTNLPYSKKEVNKCFSICGKKIKATQFISKDANKDNFYMSLNSPNIVHLSSHMHYSNIDSDYNFLYLNDNGKPDSFYQWDLMPDKIKTPFVVLSTCYSGEGTYYKSEGIDSFVRSFYMIGVDNVLYTRWNIEDQFSSLFFPEFYKHLLPSLSIPSALRKTKIQFINSPKYSHPAFWAAINSI
jgi:CHAT domain-containing protein